MNRRRGLGRRWIWIPCILLVLAVSGFAVEHSIVIRASWKVLPYQTLQLGGSQGDVAAVSMNAPVPTPYDYTRGYVDAEHAVRLHVVSNTPWKIQVSGDPAIGTSLSDLQIRTHGGEFTELAEAPQILDRGDSGVFEISVDYRILLGHDDGSSSLPSATLVFTIMSD